MTNLFEKFSFVAASTVISLTVIHSHPVNAASVIYNFEVSIDSGFLASETYSGTFSFDDSGLIGIGEEFLSVSDLTFNFNGTEYNEADGVPEVAFFDGDFLGLSFSIDAKFSLIPGFFDISEAEFFYEKLEGAGAGDITYNAIPEPLTILGTLSAIGFGSFFKRKLTSK